MNYYERKKTNMATIPVELISEILSRMPPKDAIKMSCVCSSWRTLLNSPRFLSLHLKNFTRIGGNRRFFKITDIVSLIDHVHLCDNGQPSSSSTLLVTCPCNVSSRFTIIGTINGVLCLSHHCMIGIDEVYLWNPIVKKKITVPARQSFMNSPKLNRRTIEALAFGHDSATNDYKLFSIIAQKEPDQADIEGPTRFDVWSTNRMEMATVPLPSGLFFALTNRMHGAFLNGSCHWLVIRRREHDRRCGVLSVSASDYSVLVHELPEEIPNTMGRLCNVAAIDGCLGLVPHDEIERAFADVWVMREYGDTSSWMIRYRIERGEGPMPVLVWKSGEIMNHNLTAFYERRGEDVQPVTLCSDEIYISRFAESFVFLHEGRPCPCFCNLEP